MRLIPCYICDKAIEAHSLWMSLAGLCKDHDTPANRDKMLNAGYDELLRKYNHFKANKDKKPNEPEKPKPSKEDHRKVKHINEYGEPEFE